MKKGIFIAILNQGSIRSELSNLMLQLSLQDKYNLIISYPAEKPISNNRNKIVQEFLATPGMDYLLMIDGDIIPSINILNLADFQKDIIGALCFMYQQNMVIPIALKRNPEGKYDVIQFRGDEGLSEVDAVGTGCIMISREVLEKVKHPFENIYDPDGIKKYGLDISFCQKAKEQGFKVYSHLDYACSHWSIMDLKLVYQALLPLKEKWNSQTQAKTQG